jgi:uncharacterized protein (DUF1330 family)
MAAAAPAYFIAELDIHDAEAYQKYREGVPATLLPYGGRFMVRGGQIGALEGDAPKRVVVLAFPNMGEARRWYESPAYQALLPQRLKAAKARAYFVEGVA